MDIESLKAILSVPNPSGHEEFLSECVEVWAKNNGVRLTKDAKGNLYLVKGSAEFYPCVTAHLDSVIHGAERAAAERRTLEIEDKGGRLSATLDGRPCVIGGDDKAGLAISLAAMTRLKACKAAFFVEEEIGCRGSKAADWKFFDDVAFVVGTDSPDRNRAAKACSGVMLFSDEFWKEYVQPISREHGVTDFRSEPFTDVLEIRRKTGLECMNFGNGGYLCHSDREYVVWKDACAAEDLVVALCERIPCDKRHVSEVKDEPRQSWYGGSYGGWYGGGSSWTSWKTSGSSWRSGRAWRPSAPAREQPKFKFEWDFGDEDKAAEFAESLRSRMVDVDFKVEGAKAAVGGEEFYVKYAFTVAWNVQHGTRILRFRDLVKQAPEAAREYAEKVRQVPAGRKPAPRGSELPGDDRRAVVSLPAKAPRSQVWKLLQAVTDAGLPVEVDMDDEPGSDSIPTMSGKVKDLKQAWVTWVNLAKGTGYKDWAELSRKEFVSDFWSNLAADKDEVSAGDFIDVDAEEVDLPGFDETPGAFDGEREAAAKAKAEKKKKKDRPSFGSVMDKWSK